ncbi:hypothetical protein LG324_03495 [Phycicoccus jejuensis]|uniref:hypothetical protein n=1 Tax=Phycicoccus jejuensis TaxID=367299 RepID=UPI0038500179
MTPQRKRAPDTDAHLKHAVSALRTQADERWVEVADRVLDKALRVTRRSMPVRAEGTGGKVNVSEQVLIAGIRYALDQVAGALPTAIQVNTNERHHYTGVVVCVTADYGSPILPTADDIRNRTQQVLQELLGPITPSVTVNTMQVHINDVRRT